jgi:hypothetical protein
MLAMMADGARLGKIERCDSRIHLVETLAATQKLGIDGANLVEHLLWFAAVGKKRSGRTAHNAPHAIRVWDDGVKVARVCDPFSQASIHIVIDRDRIGRIRLALRRSAMLRFALSAARDGYD